MCGIAGFWNRGSGEPADRHVIRMMTESLRPRGPDEDGYFIAGDLALGMRRLQVVDPAGGRQPMANEDGSVHVVFNGEIYNHVQLRQQLEPLGHRFRTRSDTEAIVHAWEQWGTACVERFNGMFAFAVWDACRQCLFLARDRLGIKPLYVWEGRQGIVFGSELKAVLTAPWVPLDWDVGAVDDFLTYEYVPAPATIISGVRKLPQASWILLERGAAGSRARPRRFWELRHDPANVPRSPGEAAEELSSRLRTAVDRRLMADVPLGAFLSGGIDSSIIVGLMSELASRPVMSFSLGFKDRSYDELRYASAVARHFGTHHTEELVTADVLDLAQQVAGFFDEPFGDVSAFPTYMISALARRHVTVALSGDGGDELFAGYDSYRADRWARRIGWLARSRGWAFVDRLFDAISPRPAKKGLVNKSKRFIEGLRRPPDLEHARWLVFWDLAERRALYSADLQAAAAGRDCFAHYRSLLTEATEQGFGGLHRQLYADIRGYLADDILTKVDRTSMAVSLEVRVPFLDHHVVEYAMAIPAEWKLHGGRSKWILRSAFSAMLPRSVARRGKEGFSMPMKNWLRGPLQDLLRDLLSPSRLAQRGWFDVSEVQRLAEEHTAGRHNHAHRLWCLMALELSLQNIEELSRTRRGA
jgi:asparagine synthase (glutamine-hydrolysing)